MKRLRRWLRTWWVIKTTYFFDNYSDGPMWHWFELSYSSYLVLPRSLLCGMPIEWQTRMAGLLEEMRATYDPDKINGNYAVSPRNKRGWFVKDPLANYRRPPPLPYRESHKP